MSYDNTPSSCDSSPYAVLLCRNTGCSRLCGFQARPVNRARNALFRFANSCAACLRWSWPMAAVASVTRMLPAKMGHGLQPPDPLRRPYAWKYPIGVFLVYTPVGYLSSAGRKREPLHRSGSRSFPRFFPLRVAALADGDRPAASVKEAAADAICSSFLPHRVLPAAAIPSPRSGRSSPEIPHRAARSDRPAPSPPAAHRADTGIARCSPL